MKAIVWQGAGNFDFRYEDRERPRPGAQQILVKIEATAVCGSDLHLVNFRSTPPLVPGHEAAGIVVEVGAEAAQWKIGERVALDPVQRCGWCYSCTHEMEHLCGNIRHLGSAATPGSWAEYMAIDARNAYRIPEHVGFIEACLVEPAAVCYESFCRAEFKPGQDVVVIGDGPFGFLHAQIAKALGARKLVVAGHYDQRLKRIAQKTGAVVCNTHREDLGKRAAEELRDKPGVDLVIEASGAGGAPNVGLQILRPRGTMVIFSYIWAPEIMEMGKIHINELNVLGACRSRNGYEPVLSLMKQGKIDTGVLVDMTVPLEEYQKAVDYLNHHKKDVFKAVFLPTAR